MSRFDICLTFVLRAEGGYSDDPVDRGGATNFGIVQRTYDVYRTRAGLPLQSVHFITALETGVIYANDYWIPSIANECPAGLDLAMFDSAVQHGPGRAVKFLQLALGIKDDGAAGPLTIVAMRAAAPGLVQAVIDRRRAFYAAIIANDPSQQKFAHGWENRLLALEKAIA